MARTPKPWYDNRDKCWRVTINRTRHNLGSNKSEAMREFHELMASPHKPSASNSLASALDAFLDWTLKNRSPGTHERHQQFLQTFLDFVGDIRISHVKPFIVQQWYESHDWNQTTQNGAVRSLKRALNWAEQMGYCDRNPIARMPAPKPLRRNTTISPDEFSELLEHVTDDNFADLLIVSYDCGIRPQELRELQACHVQLANHCAVFPAAEAKGDNPRVFYIPTERSLAIIERLIERHPKGVLFRNRKGNSWKRPAVTGRFARLERKTGKRFRQYDFRRTWITRKIIAGVDSHVVAKLAGHASTAMLDKHYSCITEDHDFMLNAARQGEDASVEE